MPGELKPCPYCHGEPYVIMFQSLAIVQCRECEMYGPRTAKAKDAIAAWNGLPRRLRFEKNDCAPEEPGNYWFRHPNWNAGAPFIVECYHSPNPPEMTGERIVNVAGREYHIDYDDAKFFEGGEWAGPIEMPEEE